MYNTISHSQYNALVAQGRDADDIKKLLHALGMKAPDIAMSSFLARRGEEENPVRVTLFSTELPSRFKLSILHEEDEPTADMALSDPEAVELEAADLVNALTEMRNHQIAMEARMTPREPSVEPDKLLAPTEEAPMRRPRQVHTPPRDALDMD